MTTDKQPAAQHHKSRKRMFLLIPLAVTAAIFAWIFSYIDDWSRDLTTNYAKTEPDAENDHLRPQTVPHSPAKTAELLSEFARQNDAWVTIPTDANVSETELVTRLTRTTGLMRYVDDVTVHLTAIGDGCLVEIESQSRVGKGDLGQNPRNIIELNSWLSQQQDSAGE